MSVIEMLRQPSPITWFPVEDTSLTPDEEHFAVLSVASGLDCGRLGESLEAKRDSVLILGAIAPWMIPRALTNKEQWTQDSIPTEIGIFVGVVRDLIFAGQLWEM